MFNNILHGFMAWNPSTFLTTVTITLTSIILYFAYSREATPLRKIPGPFLASITKLWLVKKQLNLQRHSFDRSLHKKYGPIVRIAPNEVLVSSPESFRKIYSAGSHFRKSDWYLVGGDCGWSGEDTLDFFPEHNIEKYRVQRRAVGPTYSVDSMKDLEAGLDQTIKRDIEVMKQRAGQAVDLDIFLDLFASDCLSTATFSKTNNLVESGDDGLIAAILNGWKYMHWAGHFPLLHRAFAWYEYSPHASFMKKLFASVSSVIRKVKKDEDSQKGNPFAFAISQIQSLLANRSEFLSSGKLPSNIAEKLISSQSTKDVLKDKDHWIINICLTNFGAGVETTGITIGALIINIINHPGGWEKVHAEIDAARKMGKLSNPPKLREMRESLPYLSACMSESVRLNHVVGMPLMRVVPEGGCELEGYFLPAGTVVGINPWVFGRNKSLYGEDAEIFRPERWLEYTPEKIKFLETYNLSFGAGLRSCPGKHLAQAILDKLVPVIMDFEWSYAEPEKESKLQCTFSTRYVGLMVKWRVRDSSE